MHNQVKSFKFQNCGKSSDPIQVESLTLGPDPLKIPGNITLAVKSSTSQDLTAPIKVNSFCHRFGQSIVFGYAVQI